MILKYACVLLTHRCLSQKDSGYLVKCNLGALQCMFCPLGIELGQGKPFYLMTVKLILNFQQEMNKVQISVAQHSIF